MKNIKFKAPLFDNSGLGIAANNLYTMFKTKFPNIISFEPISLINLKIGKLSYRFPITQNYDINFIYCVPYQFNKFIEKNKINIGYTMWETDRVHPDFIDGIKNLDALLVPCTLNKNVFKKLCKNTFVMPLPMSPYNIKISGVNQQKNSNFTFYSIYDWTSRKGGQESIEAYFKEFKDHNDVRFIIKTGGPFINKIESEILEIKNRLQYKNYPALKIVVRQYSDSELRGLHNSSHCYVSLSKGEGWNLPLIDAASVGNYIISTHPSGATEYICDSELFFPVSAKKTKVTGMDWFKYVDETHKWFEPSIKMAQKQMRLAYNRWKNLDNNNSAYADYDAKNRMRSIVCEKIGYDSVAKIFEDIMNNF